MTHGEREHYAMRVNLEQFSRDWEFIDANRDAWLEEKGNIWVGVLKGKIIVEGEDNETFHNNIVNKGINPRYLATVKLGAPKVI